ncbi:FAD binding domain-containing protein [Salinarimonas sp.]|uniref:FAD binding domain-containing protein n=1 Tax=Salinarimonas sp. TaxID=2766526 RepID=UPI00391B7392
MAVSVETHASLADAARAVGSGATYLGGGTLVMRAVNAGALQGAIVRATDPALRAIQAGGEGVRIGAGATMAEILASRDLDFLHPVARAVGGPQVRAMASVGGNLFAPHPYGDFAAALIALGARALLAQGGTRAVEDLVRDRQTGGGRPPLVAAIEVARPRDPRAFGWLKVARVKPKGVSVLSIAAHLPREGGRIRGARVAFGAMGPTPLRAPGPERALEGQALDAATIARAAQAAAEGLDPPSDALASAWYRREVAGVHLRRLLESMA